MSKWCPDRVAEGYNRLSLIILKYDVGGCRVGSRTGHNNPN
jgi:hypothetical protein